MPMERFDFPYHSFEVEYPESSPKITFGGGYEFVSRPKAPDQVTHHLHFVGMSYHIGTQGNASTQKNLQYNIRVLELFYQRHRLYEKFIYPHPVEGDLIVRFKTPLKFRQVPGGLGVIEPFTVTLITQP
ncbi:hypothetical protein [Palleronia sp.]|uniref:hypothetical protein n=1 Tax=Palleronia sp. TaxID=1940284 RepID=UPI0035C7EEA1